MTESAVDQGRLEYIEKLLNERDGLRELAIYLDANRNAIRAQRDALLSACRDADDYLTTLMIESGSDDLGIQDLIHCLRTTIEEVRSNPDG